MTMNIGPQAGPRSVTLSLDMWRFAQDLGVRGASPGIAAALLFIAQAIKDGAYTPEEPIRDGLIDALLAKAVKVEQ